MVVRVPIAGENSAWNLQHFFQLFKKAEWAFHRQSTGSFIPSHWAPQVLPAD
jgi:hypothetical protein